MENYLNDWLDSNKESAFVVELLKNNADNERTDVIKKVLIVLVITKLEVFIESTTKKYYAKLKEVGGISSYYLPETMVSEIVKQTYYELSDDLKRGKVADINKSKLRNFQLLTEDFMSLDKIDLEFKITVSDHGSKEIEKIFKKIGIENIYVKIEEEDKLKKKDENIFGIKIESSYDYRGFIDRFTKYRNNIIHEDHMDLISTEDIYKFISMLNKFSLYVIDILDEMIGKIQEAVVVESTTIDNSNGV